MPTSQAAPPSAPSSGRAPALPPNAAPDSVDFGSLPWNSSAIVLWLEEGEKPNGTEHFCSGATLSPPECNPLAWWNLGQAVSHVGTNRNSHGKLPWIKAGEVVLAPADVFRSYDFYKHHGTRK